MSATQSGNGRKVTYGPDGKTIVEVDYLTNGKATEVDIYNGGVVSSITHYLSDGRTVSETDAYSYLGGKLASIDVAYPLSHLYGTYFFNTDGSIKEIDAHLTDQNGIYVLSGKLTGTGAVTELDHYSAGKMTDTQTFNPLGEVTKMVSYATDGLTVRETDNYTYDATSANVLTETKLDGTGKLFETDTFAYGKYGAISQETKMDGSGKVTEIDQYDSFGHLVSVTHPSTTPPANVTLPTLTTQWSSVSGFGEIDVLKALTAVLGKAPADIAAPQAIQSQWDLEALHFQDAWSAGYTGKGVVVADIDSGIDLKNASLTKNLSQYDWNFINNTSNVQDDNGHGTCTAAEIAAANDGKGVTGGAYDSQLMVLKVMDASGSGSDSNVVSAINYAVTHGANVINMSLGSTTPDTTLQAAIRNASSHGVIVCVAAGNNGSATPAYPATYAQGITDCIAVGATQQSGSGVAMTSFSDKAGAASSYNFVDAPGSSVKGYGMNGIVYNWSGTSMAAPLVAAEAADLLSAHTSLTVDQIVQDIVHATVSLVGIAAA